VNRVPTVVFNVVIMSKYSYAKRFRKREYICNINEQTVSRIMGIDNNEMGIDNNEID